MFQVPENQLIFKHFSPKKKEEKGSTDQKRPGKFTFYITNTHTHKQTHTHTQIYTACTQTYT